MGWLSTERGKKVGTIAQNCALDAASTLALYIGTRPDFDYNASGDMGKRGGIYTLKLGGIRLLKEAKPPLNQGHRG
jgi:hypothetical protein